MAYQSEHTGAEVDAAVAWVKAHMDQLNLLMAFLDGEGNARINATTKNLQARLDTDFHDIGIQDQGDSESGPLIVPVADQTPDN